MLAVNFLKSRCKCKNAKKVKQRGLIGKYSSIFWTNFLCFYTENKINIQYFNKKSENGINKQYKYFDIYKYIFPFSMKMS